MPSKNNKRKRTDNNMEYFDFEYNGSEELDDSKLEELKEELLLLPNRHDRQQLRKFIIHEPYWSESLLRSFVDLFRHFSEQGMLWDSLQLIPARDGQHLSSTSHCYLRPLLFCANTMNLFREIHVCAPLSSLMMIPGGGEKSSSDTESSSSSILAGALLNTRLESLSISCPFETMADGDFQALLELLRRTTTLQELTLNGLAITSGELADALARNKTLRRISLNLTANDRGLSGLIQEGLSSNHQSLLQEFTIQTDNQFGPLSSKSLQTLLKSSKTLQSLTLQDNSPYCPTQTCRKLNLIDILNGLKASRCIQSLSFQNVFSAEEHLILSQFFQVLPSIRTLKRLDLLRTTITRQDLEQVTTLPRLPKAFRLHLDRRILLDHTGALCGMLQQHPEIRRPWPRNVVAETEEGYRLKHVWELNWYGRSLLLQQRQPQPQQQSNNDDDSNNKNTAAPLSLWPTILEKANDKPDVLLAFLKGPAFAGSQNYI